MAALRGRPTIGDDINKKIIAPLANANKLPSMPDFNDPEKFGAGKGMVERLTNLIAIFENKALDFSKNRAEGDDIPGDAYEYLMHHFATESGKNKGQFGAPAEVSRIMAKIIGVAQASATASTTGFDPTCGSGSLLLKVADAAKTQVSLYGQKKTPPPAVWIRFYLELAKKPLACLGYIIVHELAHLIEPTHNSYFIALMDRYLPQWAFYREELNRLPVRHERWGY